MSHKSWGSLARLHIRQQAPVGRVNILEALLIDRRVHDGATNSKIHWWLMLNETAGLGMLDGP